MNSERLRQKELADSRAFRQDKNAARKRTALKMLADGFTVAEAARAVRADPNTVKAWRDGVRK